MQPCVLGVIVVIFIQCTNIIQFNGMGFLTGVRSFFIQLIYLQHIFIVEFYIKVLKNIWFGLGKVFVKSP